MAPLKRFVILGHCSREAAISMSRDKSNHVMICFSTAKNVYTDYITAVVTIFTLIRYLWGKVDCSQTLYLRTGKKKRAKRSRGVRGTWGLRAKRAARARRIYISRSPSPTQSSLLFCAGVQFSRALFARLTVE